MIQSLPQQIERQRDGAKAREEKLEQQRKEFTQLMKQQSEQLNQLLKDR